MSHAHWLIFCCCVCFVHSMGMSCERASIENGCFRLCSVIRFAIKSRGHTHSHTKGVIIPNTWLRSMVYLRLFSCFFSFIRQAPPAQRECDTCWFAAVLVLCFSNDKMRVALDTHTRWAPFPVIRRQMENILNIYFLIMNWIDSTETETGNINGDFWWFVYL